jgi:hypothetical protein
MSMITYPAAMTFLVTALGVAVVAIGGLMGWVAWRGRRNTPGGGPVSAATRAADVERVAATGYQEAHRRADERKA